ncbi:hypothetical protein GOODEAATRI_010473 [Goodea atripinnis]|uniref:Uncharacterized protein n=1 Tax=Goodea atripinnis TaxID=208336 RepID=A0ABV0PD03_9TELE
MIHFPGVSQDSGNSILDELPMPCKALVRSHYNNLLFLLSVFPFQESPQRVIYLHQNKSAASSSLTPTTFMPSFTTSIYLLLSLPLGLLSGSSSLNILLSRDSLSLFCTCLNHLSQVSLALSPTDLR